MDNTVNWFEKRCRLNPSHIAVVDGQTGERWTYRDMDRRFLSIAAYLQSQGVEKGDRVALLSPNDVCYFDMLFACAKLGAIFVPLNWRLAAPELDYIIHNCDPKVIAVHPDLDEINGNVLTKVQESHFKLMKAAGKEYDDIIRMTAAPTSNPALKMDDPLSIIYTGGTTGKPKGVVLSHASMFWNAINTVVSWNLTSRDITPTYMPMFHTGGLNALSLPILQIGGTVIVCKSFRPETFVEIVRRERCTLVLLVPTMYHMLTQSEVFAEASFPTMHTFLSGGAPCPHTIYEAFASKGLAFKEGYGMTEAGPNNFFIDPSEAAKHVGSVGMPMMLNDIKIVNNHGETAVVGEVGEILLKGGHLFHSYWNLPKETEEAFSDRWFHTGDLGRRDDEGFFYIMGRKKDMIITGGENVYPLEVEHLLQQHPYIEEAAVVGIPDEKWGEQVIAVLVLKSGAHLDEETLKQYCAASIGKYKIPKRFVFAEELPKTAVGKIDKIRIIHDHSYGKI
ncbi:long-chain fatty acid--CoA ligase [Paenibacillus sediminis]|uniref:Fatty-acyl-CoA synthase n=1 Tax=Paenibacillus sediminis TaxID=664909 RepID=A0ABS4H1J7_9BACL|nr:long-chain fatty acid--CoA ligase [Paenibacillus sediminis]MBP1936142.1 fatty-acyl-CoA synthase [Paenibacillus sediminis]